MNWITQQVAVCSIEELYSEKLHPEVTDIISVCQDTARDNVPNRIDYHHYSLADGPEIGHVPGDSSFAEFFRAVAHTVDLIKQDKKIIIHCHKGRNRSVTVAACALAYTSGKSLETALDIVVKTAGNKCGPNAHMMDHARKFDRIYLQDY